MSRPANKYERVLKKKEHLECLYDRGGNNGYPVGVVFLLADNAQGEQMEDCYLKKSINKYTMYERPDGVDYTPLKFYRFKKHNTRESRTSYLKKCSNRALRNSKEIYRGSKYKKVFDYWWKLT